MQYIIDIYGENYLKDILSDYDKLSKIYMGATIEKSVSSDSHALIDLRKALDIYICKLQLSGRLLNTPFLENYRRVFSNTINSDITYIFENRLLQLPSERLNDIMSYKVIESIDSRKSKIESECFKIYDKLINGELVKAEERNLLTSYLRDTVGTRDTKKFHMQEEVVKRIINEKGNYDYNDASLLVSFIACEEAKKYDLEILSNTTIFKDNPTARGYASRCEVNINSDYAIKSLNGSYEDKAYLLHTICHEVKHIEQNHSIATNVNNQNTLNCLIDKIFRSELSEKEFNYYHNNYYFESGEKDAEKVGFINSSLYINKYVEDENTKKKVYDDMLTKKDHQIYIELIEMRKDKDNKKIEADKFRIEKMQSVLTKKPEYMEKFPQLKTLYSSDGKLKPFQERLVEYANFKKHNPKDASDIYYASFNYSIDNGDIEKLDFSSMSTDQLYAVMHVLSDIYNKYAMEAHNNLEAKRLGQNYLNEEKDINNSTTYLNQHISIMASRYKKLETILDPFYDKLGDDYGKIEAYSYDKFIYEKDKKYARDNFKKIKEINNRGKNDEEIKKMLDETNIDIHNPNFKKN